ncbi:hypothetical protein L1D55_12670 [Vibrio sp. Isolate22]|uniref:hypothetical protein n=1 Tax=Vibrio sp. Isolate22 TaxID=2908532 RepID=UPI001EFE3859|nr:hypothetical protein [Vibrio sp. Isolate22]MCG9692584.1 hypothetical protein [Vibrio sp. Isolate22]
MNSQLRRVSCFASPFCLVIGWLSSAGFAYSLLTDIFKLITGDNIKRAALPKIPPE